MWSSSQVKTGAVLTLLCMLHCSVYGERDVVITVRNEENNPSNMRFVTFTVDIIRKFHGCMCGSAQNCSLHYSLQSVPFVDVTEVVSSTVQNKTAMPVYQCKNVPSQPSLNCNLLNEYSVPEKYVQAQTFSLNNPDCQSRYVTLVWFHDDESLTVNADIPDFEFCKPAFDCALTALRPVTPSASSRTSSLSPESFTPSGNKDEDDGNAGVIAGVAVAVFIVGIGVGIVVVVVMVRWKRRKNQGTKEPEDQIVNSPPPTSLALSDVTSAADLSTNAYSVPSEASEGSPREPTSVATVSVPQNDYSQPDVSNTDKHAYAALSSSPYYNSTNEISTESTGIYEQNADTHNSRAAYYNTPDTTPNSSSAYFTIPTTATVYSSTQRGPTNTISNQPDTETEGPYEEADVAHYSGRGDCVNLNASVQHMTEQNDNTIYCN